MTKLVVLPFKVAKAIEELRSEGFTDFGIITGMTTTGQGAFNTINQWSYKNGCSNTDKVLSAVVNGYEIEGQDFGKFTDVEIYLGLVALSLKDDENGWFIKGAADAFIRSGNQIIDLLEELKIENDPNYDSAEWYKQHSSLEPNVKEVSFESEEEKEAFISEMECEIEDSYASKVTKTREVDITKFESIQKVKEQEASKRVYVNEDMKLALDEIALKDEEMNKERCIPGVTQPSEEAMKKALQFLLKTSVPRLIAKERKEKNASE